LTHRARVAVLLVALLCGLAPTVRATATPPVTNLGGLVAGYGAGGRVKLDLGRGSDGAATSLFDSQGRLVVLLSSTEPNPPGWDGYGGYSHRTLMRLLPDGSVDRSYGDNGFVHLVDPNAPEARYDISSFALTPDDGAVVEVGRYPADFTVHVMRLDSDGQPVTTFGSNGAGFTPLGYSSAFEPDSSVIAARPGGGVIVSGRAYPPGATYQPIIRALDADGNLDTSFGTNGQVVLDPGTNYNALLDVRELLYRPDGKLVVGTRSTSFGRTFLLTPNGTIDTSFGNAGHVDTPFGPSEGSFWNERTLVHPSDAITVFSNAAVYRFLPNGQPDLAFGTDGTTPATAKDKFRGAAADGEASVVMEEARVDNEVVMRFHRFTPAGQLDPTFGNGGTRDIAYAAFAINYVAGSYVAVNQTTHDVVGVTYNDISGRSGDAVLIALDGTGDRKRSFGVNGIGYYDNGFGGDDRPGDVEPDANGGLWIASSSDTGVVLHLDASGHPVTSFGTDGVQPALRGGVGPIVPAPDGGLYVISWETPEWGKLQYLVSKMRDDGSPDPAVNRGTPMRLGTLTDWSTPVDATMLADGRLAVVLGTQVLALHGDGTSDDAFGVAGSVTTTLTGAPKIRPHGDGFLLASLEPTGIAVGSYDGNGGADTAFGSDGVATIATTDTLPVTNVIVGDSTVTVGTGHHVFRLLSDGAADATFTPLALDPSGTWVDFGVQSDGSVVVAGSTEARHYTATGALDLNYGLAGTILPGLGAGTGHQNARVVTRGSVTHFVSYVYAMSGAQNTDIGVVARDSHLGGGVPVGTLTSSSVTEGNSGRSRATLTITLDRPVDDAATSAEGQLTSQTGTVGLDAEPASLYFTPSTDGTTLVGSTYATGDVLPEGDETLGIRATSPNHLILANDTGTLTITDDDPAVPATGATFVKAITPYDRSSGGARVALGDLDGNGTDEIITGTAPGRPAVVTVYTQSGNVSTLRPYSSTFTGGVNVAAGDVDGDGKDELIVSPARNAAALVRVFDYNYGSFTRAAVFFGLPSTATHGAWLSSADVDGDGRDEVVVGAGDGGGSQIRIISIGSDGATSVLSDFKAFGATFAGGARVAGADVDGDGNDEVVAAAGPGGTPLVRVFDIADNHTSLTTSCLAFARDYRGGVTVAGGDLDGDPYDEIVTGAGAGGRPSVAMRDFDATGGHPGFSFVAYEWTYTGGVSVAVGRAESNSNPDIVTTPGAGRVAAARVFRMTF
jgi:uncharacterized delta-60 repeat protein